MSKILTDKNKQTQTKLLLIEVNDIVREQDVVATYTNYSIGYKEGDIIHATGTSYTTVKAIFTVPAIDSTGKMVARDVRIGLTTRYGNELNPSNRYFLEKALGLPTPKFETAIINDNGDWFAGLSIDDKIEKATKNLKDSDMPEIDFDNLEKDTEGDDNQSEIESMVTKLITFSGTRFRVNIENKEIKIGDRDIRYETFDMSTLILDPKFNQDKKSVAKIKDSIKAIAK